MAVVKVDQKGFWTVDLMVVESVLGSAVNLVLVWAAVMVEKKAVS